MMRLLSLCLFSSIFASCKILPGNIRSEVKSADVAELLDEDSVKFQRTAEGSGGDLSFRMKDKYNCRIQYWTTDINAKPAPSSPMALDCPNDGQRTDINFSLEGLTPGVNLKFRIMLWPRSTSFLSNFAYEFAEGGDLSRVQTAHLVVSRYNVARNSNEIFTYQFESSTNAQDIKNRLLESLAKRNNVCSEGAGDITLPFPRMKSQEDGSKRPLHGLAKLSTDGFAQGVATAHPFFPTRLMQFYDDVDRQQNWKWSFEWEGRRSSFEITPPGYLADVTLTDGETNTNVKNKLLGNALPSVEVSSKPFVLTPSIQFLTDLASFQLSLKTTDGNKTVLRCDFPVKEANISIPSTYYQKLPAGEYLATLTFETHQIYTKSGSEYPPWLFSAQDWTSFKIIKKQ